MNATVCRYFLISFFVILFTGCASSGKKELPPSQRISTTELSPAEQLLQQAQISENPRASSTLFLEAAVLLMESGLFAQADYAVSAVQPDQLTEEQLLDWQLLKLEISLISNDTRTIKELLSAIDLNSALQTTLSRQEKIVRICANSFSKIDKPLEAAVLLADYEGVFGLSKSSLLNEEIWLLLQRTETDILTSYTYTGGNPNTEAWLDLARQVKLNQASIDDQFHALQRWLTDNPEHPATQALPLELDLLSELPQTAPNKIILALPLSGQLEKIGRSILEGFLASYFYHREAESVLEVTTFDTASNNMQDLYESISEDEILTGKTLIVGPVTKSDVEAISTSGLISIPTLALNSSSSVAHQAKLFLFGLNPEQEVEQIAIRLADNNLHRVAFIASNDERNKQLAKAFKDKFEKFGGHLVSTAYFDPKASPADSVANLLATDKSTSRSRALIRATGLKLESKPRRRQDIDAILMIADHNTAKQIKPLLAFNFAQDIPVYANSGIHIPGRADNNNDLSGVKFVDIPWVFTQANPLRAQVDFVRKDDSERYARFYALGADAYLLAPRLNLLYEIPNSHVQGLTGKLNINAQGEIERKLQWATYRRGKVVTIN